MISLQQMRAARGLLNWTQSELAEKCGISVTAMNNIDRENAIPRTTTLQTIQRLFEGHGVEFTEGHGVRLREDVFDVEFYKGKSAFRKYLDDVVQTLRITGGKALHLMDTEELFINDPKDRRFVFDYFKKMLQYGLEELVLVREGVVNRYGPADCSTYRWCSPELASQIGMSVYGNKYCIFLLDKIVVIENADVANAYRRQFMENWKKSKKPPPAPALFDEDMKRWGQQHPPFHLSLAR